MINVSLVVRVVQNSFRKKSDRKIFSDLRSRGLIAQIKSKEKGFFLFI